MSTQQENPAKADGDGDKSTDVVRPKVMSVTIKDHKTLYSAYMPFIKNGGIFVPTNSTYGLGDEIFLILKLMDDEQYSIAGAVVWTTPRGAQSNRTSGVGIQFKGPEGESLRNRIESILGGLLKSRRPTHTM